MTDRVWKGKPIQIFEVFKKKYPLLSDTFVKLVEKTLQESEIDRKTQELIIVTLLAAKFEEGFKFHLQEALRQGATKGEILGGILLLLPYSDIGTFLTALSWAKAEGIF